ncbi:MAG: hypothetical protein GTO29_08920 [Candidatus Latescibacteria bacterium]|nr:hypothetical protein [Candidatus Latescibacterota bacterium]NIO56285.1 hypothetical protein [Candidatus Latescibacterota bacterium]
MKPTKLIIPTIAILSLMLLNCSQSGPSITTDEVIVKADKLDVHFSRIRSFANTYVIFGGIEMNQSAAISKISLSGLEINIARSIYSRYPDFHMCKSPGAPLAQREVRDLDIVPANSNVMKNLKKTLALHKKSLEPDGKRVCVRLEGEVLKLKSAIVRQLNEDITSQLPPQVHHDYYLVESAEVIEFQEAIASN